MQEPPPLLGIILGSLSDYEFLKQAVDLIERWGVPYEILVASSHRTPERVAEWSAGAEERGLQVIIAAAGMAAHLPGVVAAHTSLPVIGVPIETGALLGVDALYSIVQMPAGNPVASVSINGAVNAAVLALQILARIDERWRAPLAEHRRILASRIEEQNSQLRAERPGAIWPPVRDEGSIVTVPPRRGRQEGDPTRAATPTTPRRSLPRSKTAARIERIAVEPDMIPMEIVERAADCLLRGGVLAIPTDTVYGLAVDATNVEAVRKLFELKGRAASQAIAVFLDSQRALVSLAKGVTPEIRNMLEAFWPGPLTVVFEKQGTGFEHLAPGPTIGVRIPDHSVPLTLMQELRRPIACTSANLSGEPEARSADEIERIFGGQIDMILDAGELPESSASTVIDVTQVPFRLLREGRINRTQLAAVVGDLISDDEEEEGDEE